VIGAQKNKNRPWIEWVEKQGCHGCKRGQGTARGLLPLPTNVERSETATGGKESFQCQVKISVFFCSINVTDYSTPSVVM
jgi:hypothetical protein